MAIKFGLAVNAEIAEKSIFARKNYFYPDLPKGYQISQYELPIVFNGSIEIPIHNKRMKKIRITRAHLEEDAGKSIHDKFHNASAIDLNRAGTPCLRLFLSLISALPRRHLLICRKYINWYVT